MLPRALAEVLGYDLRMADWLDILTANGPIRVPRLSLAEVRIGDAIGRDVQAVCHALDDPALPVLIGLSFLREFVVTLDFPGGFLTLDAN